MGYRTHNLKAGDVFSGPEMLDQYDDTGELRPGALDTRYTRWKVLLVDLDIDPKGWTMRLRRQALDEPQIILDEIVSQEISICEPDD